MGHGQKNHVGNAMYKKAKTNLGAAVISGALGDNALSQEVLSLAVNQIETVQISRNDEKKQINYPSITSTAPATIPVPPPPCGSGS